MGYNFELLCIHELHALYMVVLQKSELRFGIFVNQHLRQGAQKSCTPSDFEICMHLLVSKHTSLCYLIPSNNLHCS